VLGSCFEFYDVLCQWRGSQRAYKVENTILLWVDTIDSERIGSDSLAILRKPDNPLNPITTNIILNLQKLIQRTNNRFNLITLINLPNLHQQQIRKFLRKSPVFLTNIINKIIVLCWEFYYFLDEGVMAHAFWLLLGEDVALFEEDGYDLEGVLELCAVVHVAEGVFFALGEGGVLL